MTGFFSYNHVSAVLALSDSIVFSPPYHAIRNDGATAVTAIVRMTDGNNATLQNIQPGQSVKISFDQLRTGSGATLQGLRRTV